MIYYIVLPSLKVKWWTTLKGYSSLADLCSVFIVMPILVKVEIIYEIFFKFNSFEQGAETPWHNYCYYCHFPWPYLSVSHSCFFYGKESALYLGDVLSFCLHDIKTNQVRIPLLSLFQAIFFRSSISKVAGSSDIGGVSPINNSSHMSL